MRLDLPVPSSPQTQTRTAAMIEACDYVGTGWRAGVAFTSLFRLFKSLQRATECSIEHVQNRQSNKLMVTYIPYLLGSTTSNLGECHVHIVTSVPHEPATGTVSAELSFTATNYSTGGDAP